MIVGTIALLMMLFGADGTLENYLLNIKKPVKAAVESKQTANEVIELSKDLSKELKTENKEITELKKVFLDLHTNYTATQSDFDAVLKKMITVRNAGQKEILDTRFAMKDLLSETEWNAVFGTENKM